MPVVFTTHPRPHELETEFREIWRAIDGIKLVLEWYRMRLEQIEQNLGLDPPPPPAGGEWPPWGWTGGQG